MANITRNGTPDIHTEGKPGDICTDSKTGKQYKCMARTSVKTDDGYQYTYSWKDISTGSGGGGGETGPQGPDGKSAYQVWLDAGNTGTVSDFLASLKGAKGDKGDKGDFPVKGIDYFTPTDKNEIVADVLEAMGDIPE